MILTADAPPAPTEPLAIGDIDGMRATHSMDGGEEEPTVRPMPPNVDAHRPTFRRKFDTKFGAITEVARS